MGAFGSGTRCSRSRFFVQGGTFYGKDHRKCTAQHPVAGSTSEGYPHPLLALFGKSHYRSGRKHPLQQRFQQRCRPLREGLCRGVPLRQPCHQHGYLPWFQRRRHPLEHQRRAGSDGRRPGCDEEGIPVRSPGLLHGWQILCYLVQRLSRPHHRHGMDGGFQDLPSAGKCLPPL